jgi:hypothetical protein
LHLYFSSIIISDQKAFNSPNTFTNAGVSLDFKDYIEAKIGAAMETNKNRGKRRDVPLLVQILTVLFRERHTPDRTTHDILAKLLPTYPALKYDTLEDNLTDFLAKVPTDEPFVKISSENQGVKIYDLSQNIKPIDSVQINRRSKPRNVYTLNERYLQDYYEKEVGLALKSDAYMEAHQEKCFQVDIVLEAEKKVI